MLSSWRTVRSDPVAQWSVNHIMNFMCMSRYNVMAPLMRSRQGSLGEGMNGRGMLLPAVAAH